MPNKNTVLTQTNCIPLFPDPKRPQKNKKTAILVTFIFFDFQPPKSNLQKNHVKIDVFKEPKYHFDPNQVNSTSFRAHNTPNKQKKQRFCDIYFGRNASAASMLGGDCEPPFSCGTRKFLCHFAIRLTLPCFLS